MYSSNKACVLNQHFLDMLTTKDASKFLTYCSMTTQHLDQDHLTSFIRMYSKLQAQITSQITKRQHQLNRHHCENTRVTLVTSVAIPGNSVPGDNVEVHANIMASH